MSSVTLVFDKSVATPERPATFEALSSLIESAFPYVQVTKAVYIDDDGDPVTVSTTKDLLEAYRLCGIWQRPTLELKLEGNRLTQSFMTESVVQRLEPERKLSLDRLNTESVFIPPAQEVPKPREEVPKPREEVPKPREEVPKPREEVPKPREEVPKPREEVPKPREEAPPKPVEEERKIECLKCMGRGTTLRKLKPCKWCNGTGLMDLARSPKVKRILDLVRKEVSAAIERNEILKAAKELERTQGVHAGIRCDGCSMAPIVGCRYKCSVCKNFDYCCACEEARQHEHPFLKIRRPEQNPAAIFTIVSEDPQGSMISARPVPSKPERLSCKFVKDMEGRDGDVVGPGSTVRKVWRVKNTGKAWPENCTFKFVCGSFQGEPISLPPLQSGEELNVAVVCTAPQVEGRFQSFWQAHDAKSESFGDRLWIDINVQKPQQSVEEQLQYYLSTDPILTSEVLATVGGDLRKAVERMKELHS